MFKISILLAAGVTALVVVAPAAATPPTHTTTVSSFSFVDDETCAFPFNVEFDRTRTITTFESGDQQWHVRLDITSTANGKTWTDRDAYTIFMDAATPDLWTIVGAFTHTRASGPTVFLQSGRLVYDAVSDTIIDLSPGPHGTGSDPDEYAAAVCSALAP